MTESSLSFSIRKTNIFNVLYESFPFDTILQGREPVDLFFLLVGPFEKSPSSLAGLSDINTALYQFHSWRAFSLPPSIGFENYFSP